VSEIFELEQALVDAARRHHRRGVRGAARRARRRFGRPLRIAAPALAVVALAVVVVIIARLAAAPDPERAAAPPTARDAFQRGFAIFRRPARASDALSAQIAFSPSWETQRARLLGTAGGQRAFAVPAGRDLCVVTSVSPNGVNSACTPVTSIAEGERVLASRSRRVGDGRALVVVVVPDGVAEVRIELRDGTIADRRVSENAVFASLPSQAVSVSWTDPAGHAHAQRLGAGQRCPLFDPLPADAFGAASALALSAFPPAGHARVASVKRLERGDRGGDLYAKCGATTASRAVLVDLHVDAGRSASLSQVSLLIGRIEGRMRVWERLH
jgi:hypothetical protein